MYNIAFSCVAFPVLHILGLIETLLPRYFNRSVCTKMFYGSLIIFMLLGIGTAALIKRAILQNGYFHCEGAAIHRRLLRIETFVLCAGIDILEYVLKGRRLVRCFILTGHRMVLK